MAGTDRNEICFQCPNCGHDLKQPADALREGWHMTCPGCNVGINIDVDSLAKVSDEIQSAADKVPPEITIKFYRSGEQD